MKHYPLLLTAAAVFVLDRAAKLCFETADLLVLPGIVAFHGTRNTGMAFGLLAGQSTLLIVLTLLTLLALFLFLRRHALPRTAQYGVGLMLGGALGNLFDRVFLGYVIDFIDLLFVRFSVFNIADIGVTCGAVLLGICILRKKDEKSA